MEEVKCEVRSDLPESLPQTGPQQRLDATGQNAQDKVRGMKRAFLHLTRRRCNLRTPGSSRIAASSCQHGQVGEGHRVVLCCVKIVFPHLSSTKPRSRRQLEGSPSLLEIKLEPCGGTCSI